MDSSRSGRRGAAAVSHQRVRGDDARAARARRQSRDAAEVLCGRLLGDGGRDTRCTWLNVVPTIVSYLAGGRGARARLDCRAIRFCRSASAALPPEHHRAFEAKFGIGIIETMGLTETVAPAFSNPIEPQLRKVGSVGRAVGL